MRDDVVNAIECGGGNAGQLPSREMIAQPAITGASPNESSNWLVKEMCWAF